MSAGNGGASATDKEQSPVSKSQQGDAGESLLPHNAATACHYLQTMPSFT